MVGMLSLNTDNARATTCARITDDIKRVSFSLSTHARLTLNDEAN